MSKVNSEYIEQELNRISDIPDQEERVRAAQQLQSLIVAQENEGKQQIEQAKALPEMMQNVQDKDDYVKDVAKDFPGLTAGAALGMKVMPTLPNPVANFISKGLGAAGGGLIGSEVTGPYVKPYTDAIYDAVTDPENKRVIALGDDFDQGQPLMGSPSIIQQQDPYMDSSSTGVMPVSPLRP